MAGDERASKTAERCHAHPGAAAVARCAHCERPVCIACAVPVRGAVVGAECLSAELGSPWTPAAPGGRLALSLSGAAMMIALVATLCPWTRLGRWLAAWAWPIADDVPWAMLAATGSLAGCLLWLVARRRERVQGIAIALAAAGLVVGLGSSLSIANPPAFTHAWFGPYVALPAGLGAALAAAVAARRARTMS
jgi:hypothetical protein